MIRNPFSTTAVFQDHASILPWSGSSIRYICTEYISWLLANFAQNASVSLATQKQDALKADYMVVPGGKLPTGETLPSNTATASATSSTLTSTLSSSVSSTTAVAAASTSTTSPAPSSSKGLSDGAIAGIVVGGVVGLAIVGALLFCLGRHKTELEFLRRDLHIRERQAAPPEMTTQYSDRPPISPSLRSDPRDPRDPRLGVHQYYDVNPYVKPPLLPEPRTPELASGEVMNSRPHSPGSDSSETRRDTASPPQMGLMESIAPEIGHNKFAVDDRPKVPRSK